MKHRFFLGIGLFTMVVMAVLLIARPASASNAPEAGSSPDWTVTGEGLGQWFGGIVASAGDVNGVGYTDLAIGGWGRAYAYFGSVAARTAPVRASTLGGVTFSVNSTSDVVDANPGDGVCATADGTCSLRAAIQEADALAGDENITLPAGDYALMITPGTFFEDDPASGDLDVTGNLTLAGAGQDQTVIRARGMPPLTFRVFDIKGGAGVVLTGVSVEDGRPRTVGGGIYNSGVLTLSDSRITNNVGDGGGIYNTGILTIIDSDISGNTAKNKPGHLAGGIFNTGSLSIDSSTLDDNSAWHSGGIYNTGTLTINNSTLSGNVAVNRAGGIFSTGTVTVTNSTLSVNLVNGVADTGGGGIFIEGGTLVISGSTLSGNSARDGSGIYVTDGGTVLITNSTLSDNSASLFHSFGGGIYASNSSTVVVANSTVWGNSAFDAGGGVFATASSTVSWKNSILAGNTAATGPDCYGTLNSQTFSLIQDVTGCYITGDTTGNVTNLDPLLGPLQDNGGPTLTHALLADSPAIDAGNPAGCTDDQGTLLLTDQRSYNRPVDGDGDSSAVCDIGAFEYGAAP